MKEFKSTDLMVGDWLYAIDEDGRKQPCRANDLKYDFTNNRADFSVDFSGTDFEPEWPDIMFDTAPIPLTKKILQKNGFEVMDQGGGRCDAWTGFGPDCEGDIEVTFQNGRPVHLKIDGTFKGEYYTSNNVKYVHQLQDALRRCGTGKEILL